MHFLLHKRVDFDRSVCMAAICYSDPTWTIFLNIVALSWRISYTEFRDDILSNKKNFDTRTRYWSFSLYVTTNKKFLGKKITCAKFQIEISKTEGLVHVYTYKHTDRSTNRPTWPNRLSPSRWSFKYLYILYRVSDV